MAYAATHWDTFKEHVESALSRVVSNGELAACVKMSPASLKRTLGRAPQDGDSYAKPARNCKLLKIIETFMHEHFSNNFSTIGAAIEMARGNKPKRVLPWDAAGHEHWEAVGSRPKRVCVHISTLGQSFIDAYVTQYVALKGNAFGRKALVAAILEAVKSRLAELQAEAWTAPTVLNRLKNSASKLSDDHWSKRA